MQDQVNPYAPPKAVVRDEPGEAGFEMASRGSRMGAASLDTLAGFIVALPMLIAVSADFVPLLTGELPTTSLLGRVGSASVVSMLLALILIVVTIVLVNRNAQTIGKKLVGIKVARSDGSKAGIGRIFWLRNVVNLLPSMIPVIGTVYSLVDLLFIFGAKQQCLHDMIADTIVIRA